MFHNFHSTQNILNTVLSKTLWNYPFNYKRQTKLFSSYTSFHGRSIFPNDEMSHHYHGIDEFIRLEFSNTSKIENIEDGSSSMFLYHVNYSSQYLLHEECAESMEKIT